MSSPSAGREKGHLSLQVPWRQQWAGGTGWEVGWVLRCVLSNTCTLGAAPVGSQGLEVGVASVTQHTSLLSVSAPLKQRGRISSSTLIIMQKCK